MIGIYCIRNLTNNKRYIGQSSNLKNRKWQHFSALRKGKQGNIHLQASYNKYGEDSFVFEIIEELEIIQFLTEREEYWIKYYSPDMYNTRPVSTSNAGIKFGPLSEEHKKKISEANKNRYYMGQSPEHIRKRTAHRKIPIAQIDIITGEIIKIWPSASDVNKELGIKRSRISEVCKDKAKSAGGYNWKYV